MFIMNKIDLTYIEYLECYKKQKIKSLTESRNDHIYLSKILTFKT